MRAYRFREGERALGDAARGFRIEDVAVLARCAACRRRPEVIRQGFGVHRGVEDIRFKVLLRADPRGGDGRYLPKTGTLILNREARLGKRRFPRAELAVYFA